MPNLLDASQIFELPVSIRQLAKFSGLPGTFSLLQFIASPDPVGTCVTIHLKIVKAPDTPSIAAMLLAMRSIFSPQLIGVRVGSRETLTGPNFVPLEDLDVGSCVANQITAEQATLFQNRNGAAADEPVIYFIESTIPGLYGCAAFTGQPSAVVVRGCSVWTLAHEIGHVLSLNHPKGEIDQNGNCANPELNRLMTGCSIDLFTGTPFVTSVEVEMMNNSGFSKQC